MRPISSVLPKGSMMNPEFPAAVGMRSASVPRIQDATLGCLMKAIPDKIPACPSGQGTIMAVSLQDLKSGKRFVNVINPMIGGGGASRFHDGTNAAGGFMTFLCNTPVEVNEAEVPISILKYELIPDSGGAGKYRGGLGIQMDIKFPQPNSSITARNRDRTKFRPWGVLGGKPASPSRFMLNPGTPRERNLGNLDVVKLDPGDIVSIWAPGGGGYGSPLNRDPQAVLRDTQARYISLSAARDEYGVVIFDNQVDLEATERLRSEMKPKEKEVLFDFGPERDAHESVWSKAMYDALTDLLMGMPTSLRSFAKREVFEKVKLLAEKGPVKPKDIYTSWNQIKEKYALTMD
jgi:N-methylhydantoinase B